ncbi:MAG: hypothetical protein HC938_11875 [Nitrospira sp.]|nr:hypothetical protein [Nitrospira sp.]
MTSLQDPRGETPIELTYTDTDNDQRTDEVTTQRWGTGTVTLTYDFDTKESRVADRRNHTTICQHDNDGRALRREDPTGATWTWAYDAEGLTTEAIRPLGGKTTIGYETSASRRSRGNARVIEETADDRGPNGSPSTRKTEITYHGWSNEPTRLIDPRGTVTTIRRSTTGSRSKSAAPLDHLTKQRRRTRTTNKASRSPQPTRTDGRRSSNTSTKVRARVTSSAPRETWTAWRSRPHTKSTNEVTQPPKPTREECARISSGTKPTGPLPQWSRPQRRATARPPFVTPPTSCTTRSANGSKSKSPTETTAAALSKSAAPSVNSESYSKPAAKSQSGGAESAMAYTYDENLNLIESRAPNGQTTSTIYDERDLPIEIQRGVGTPEVITETLAYNAEGQTISTTDGRANVWPIEYDGFGRAMKSMDPLGNATQVTYDANDNPLITLSLDNASEKLAETHFEYDTLDRRTKSMEMLWQTPVRPLPHVSF